MLPIATNRRLELPHYFEDFVVGQKIESDELTVTYEMIVAFAQQYDPQPMHLDEQAARSSLFGQLVGSGWQTLAVTMRLLVDARLLGGTPIVGVEFKDVRFHTPMRPGDSLRAKAEVVALHPSKSRPSRGFLDMNVTTVNTAGEVLVSQSWRLAVPRRSTSPT